MVFCLFTSDVGHREDHTAGGLCTALWSGWGRAPSLQKLEWGWALPAYSWLNLELALERLLLCCLILRAGVSEPGLALPARAAASSTRLWPWLRAGARWIPLLAPDTLLLQTREHLSLFTITVLIQISHKHRYCSSFTNYDSIRQGGRGACLKP